MIPKIIELLAKELEKDENKEHIKNFLGPINAHVSFYYYVLIIILFIILVSSITTLFFIYRFVIREKLLTSD